MPTVIVRVRPMALHGSTMPLPSNETGSTPHYKVSLRYVLQHHQKILFVESPLPGLYVY
jgi:hypothetical protein